MGTYSGTTRTIGVKRANDMGERVVAFLRSRHPSKTADNVSAETGIAATTVAKWIERACVPGGIAFVVLTACYGPEFLSAVMHSPPAWLSEASRAEERRRLEAEIAALQARLERTA